MKTTSLKIILSTIAFSVAALNLNGQDKKLEVKPSGTAPVRSAPVTPANKLQSKKMQGATNSKTPVAVQNLMKFMGRWVGKVTLVTDGKSHEVEYHLVGRGTAGGFGLYLDEFFNDSVLGNMKASNLAGYDPNDEKIHWYSVDNQGSTHDHTGTWKSPDSLFMEHSGVRKGKSYKEKINISFKGREELHLSLVATLDGKESEKLTGIFQREKPPVKPKSPGAPVKEEKKE